MSQQAKLIEFLKQELSIPSEAIALGIKQSEASPSLLPMVLWQYGVVSTYQLGQIFDWLETSV